MILELQRKAFLFQKGQYMHQLGLVFCMSCLISVMYLNSNTAFSNSYKTPSVQAYLQEAIEKYYPQLSDEKAIKKALSELNVPDDLREDYLKDPQIGVIRTQQELPFNGSCLWKLQKNVRFDTMTNYDINDLKDKSIKKIILWHMAYGPNTSFFGEGREAFVKSCCKETRCFITKNRKLMPVSKYDAVLMQYRGLQPTKWPRRRSMNQRYVFWEMESGSYMMEDSSIYRNFFNWTMSFRRDSDVYNRYGQVVSRSLDPSWKPKDFKQISNYAKGKTKLVAWFVSNCNTVSYREKYVQILQKHIQVDIYGACGKLSCPRNISEKCFELLDKNYKFYLSFENSLCKDYVTEKFYNILQHKAIPIVYGFANYEAIAPPHSYINALKFKSTRKLAEYLHYLDKNDTAYNEYFKWKKDYYVYQGQKNLPFNMCELCQKLHEDNKPKIYKDIGDWFSTKAHCKRLIPVSWIEWALSKVNVRAFPG